MQFIFVEFRVTHEIMVHDINHGHRHFIFGIGVKETDYTFQLNNYFSEKPCILRGNIDNISVAFLKSVSIDLH